MLSDLTTAAVGGPAGNYVEARAIQEKLVHLHKNLFIEPNPQGVKYAAARLNLCKNELRLPLA